ncbi:MAG: barstar family protein [Lachnospiraceae bacterium]|nr:barstar family protein [Lachnospiraceae bacterium]
MREYIVDFTDVAGRDDLHARLRDTLPLPEWYGNNLDALYDVLTEESEMIRILFLHFEDAEAALGGYANAFRHMIMDVMAENPKITAEFL